MFGLSPTVGSVSDCATRFPIGAIGPVAVIIAANLDLVMGFFKHTVVCLGFRNEL